MTDVENSEYTRSDTLRIDIERPKKRDVDRLHDEEAVPVETLDPFPRYLERAEGRVLYQVLESLYDAVLITDFGGHVLFANGRASEFFQYDLTTRAGIRVIDVISGADEGTLGWIREHLAQQRVFIECYCLADDGYAFPAEITISVLAYRVADRDYSALSFFIRNVSARKKPRRSLPACRRRWFARRTTLAWRKSPPVCYTMSAISSTASTCLAT